jgi:hypothetical protein
MAFAVLWHKSAATVDDADADDAGAEEAGVDTEDVKVMIVLIEHVCAAAVMYEVTVEA